VLPLQVGLGSSGDGATTTAQVTYTNGWHCGCTGFTRHGGSFSQLLTEATPIAPFYQNLATQTRNSRLQSAVSVLMNTSSFLLRKYFTF